MRQNKKREYHRDQARHSLSTCAEAQLKFSTLVLIGIPVMAAIYGVFILVCKVLAFTYYGWWL